MNQKTKSVVIVTPVHNRRDLTLQCLKSLSRVKSDKFTTKIIIVDDGSTDGTSEAIRTHHPEVEIIQGDGNLWFTEGTNVGVRAALKYEPDYVLMINDDQVFDDKFLDYMLETAESNPRSIVGSLLLLWDEPHKLFQVSPKWETWRAGWQLWQDQTIWTIPDKPWEVGIIVGNCVLVPTEAFKQHGLMNSRRYPNFGDAEFTPRLKKKGWKLLIDPRARVFCQPNDLPPKISKLPLKKKLDALIFNLGHTHNLRRRFYMHVDSAPTKTEGVISYGLFFFFIVWNKIARKTEFRNEQDLKDVFAEYIVKH